MMNLWWICELPYFLIFWTGLSFFHPLYDRIIFALFSSIFSPISDAVYKPLIRVDYIVLAMNIALTAPFMCHFVGKCMNDLPTNLEEMTIFNTLVCCFLCFQIYDFVYVPFHGALHHHSIYGFIHKHHHTLLTPSRGNLDAINTHPFEYLVGMYMHMVPLYVLPIHGYAGLAFLLLGSIFTALNHSRFSIEIPFFWNSLDHDVHHRVNTCNYGQYVMTWDLLFNTFQGYYDRAEKVPDYGEAREVSDRSPSKVIVIGSEGLVGHRLVEMSLERGAKEVIAIDIREKSDHTDPRVTYVRKDISTEDDGSLVKFFSNAGAVYHVAALVGPYHPKPLYYKVNVQGTHNMVAAAKAAGIEKYVYVGSPSVLFGEHELYGQHEAALSYPKVFADEYARTKAVAEQFVLKQNSEKFHACVISPHQVYGPRDGLFLPSLLENAASGKLRTLGPGWNLVSMCFVDNICHALILGANALGPESPVNGENYIVTDDTYLNFWKSIDIAVSSCGLTPLSKKFPVPSGIIYPIGRLCDLITTITGIKLKLTSYAVRMITIHRWFRIDKVKAHLGYKPVKTFEEAWLPTVAEVWERMNSKQ